MLMWGEDRAYTILLLDNADIRGIKAAWIGGVVLAVGIATGVLVFVNLYIDPPQQLGPAEEQ